MVDLDDGGKNQFGGNATLAQWETVMDSFLVDRSTLQPYTVFFRPVSIPATLLRIQEDQMEAAATLIGAEKSAWASITEALLLVFSSATMTIGKKISYSEVGIEDSNQSDFIYRRKRAMAMVLRT
ncbi:hypothetical protein PIB30_062581 [Stylosanthes scabra]|uniref:Uncharacterized protein n=1 Tax=Stylosanthes scabra TaxID=79078 RepID=A0ABU6RL52_9FABA|nr:hypothetical protein [Stylosanthes scabra]